MWPGADGLLPQGRRAATSGTPGLLPGTSLVLEVGTELCVPLLAASDVEEPQAFPWGCWRWGTPRDGEPLSRRRWRWGSPRDEG